MDYNEQLEALKQQISALQEQVQQLEEKGKHEEKKESPWALSEVGGEGYMISGKIDHKISSSIRLANDVNSFVSEDVAKGFANAFRVMILLRQGEGAGNLPNDGIGWMVNKEGETDWFDSANEFALFPPFPSKALAEAAASAVGVDNIIAAYKFLSNME